MRKIRGYLNSLLPVVLDILQVVLVMVEPEPTGWVLAKIKKFASIFVPPALFFLGAAWIHQQIPGVKNLYLWAWQAIVLVAYFGIATFIVAWRYRYQLDQHPIVEIAETSIQDGAYYYVPVTNHGPGDVEVTVTAEDAQFSDGKVDHKSFLPVEYVRWYRGSGQEKLGTPNERKICAHHSWNLYLVNINGAGTLRTQRVYSGEILAANPQENCSFLVPSESTIEITLNACGKPSLRNKAIQTVVIKIPPMTSQPNSEE